MKGLKAVSFAVLVGAAVAWLLVAKGPDEQPNVAPARPEAPVSAPVVAAEAAPAPQPVIAQNVPFMGPAAPMDDEHSLMTRIRAQGADPSAVLALAREGNATYPDSPLVEERAQRAIDALVSLSRIGEAHREAELFIERWPTGERAEHVMKLMGVHPRPKRGDAK